MATFEPFRVHVQVIGVELDDDGDPVGEKEAGQIVLHAKQFGELRARIDEAWPQVLEHLGYTEPAAPADEAAAVEPTPKPPQV